MTNKEENIVKWQDPISKHVDEEQMYINIQTKLQYFITLCDKISTDKMQNDNFKTASNELAKIVKEINNIFK